MKPVKRNTDGSSPSGRRRGRPARVKAGLNASPDGRRKTYSIEQENARRFAERMNQKMRENVRTLRTNLGWSQVHLAEQCGWARTTIVRLETGESCPSYGQLCVLAKLFGVNVGAFSDDLSWIFAANNGGTIGEELRRRRVAMGLTQDDIASRCNLTRSQYCQIESESRKPDTKELAALASCFGETIAFAA